MLAAQRSPVPKCAVCDKTVYPMEQISALNKSFHKLCFKCEVCKITLNLKNFKGSAVSGEMKPYCSTHYPTEKPSQIADSLSHKQASSAPKLQKAQGVQRNKRTTFTPKQFTAAWDAKNGKIIDGAEPSAEQTEQTTEQNDQTKSPSQTEPAETKPSPAESKPAETKPVETKPAKPTEVKPVEAKPTEVKPVEAKPAETKPAAVKPAETKPVETKPAPTKPVEKTEVKSSEVKPQASQPESTKPAKETSKPVEKTATSAPAVAEKKETPSQRQAEPTTAPPKQKTDAPARVEQAEIAQSVKEPLVDSVDKSYLTPPAKNVQNLIEAAGRRIEFLQVDECEMTVFFQMFKDTVLKDSAVEVAASPDLGQFRWKASNANIVDFNKNISRFLLDVGAPNDEVRLLNDTTKNLRSKSTGIWVDMSQADGMDGGYYLPITSIEDAKSLLEEGQATTLLRELAASSSLTLEHAARDSGSEPPRPCQLTFLVKERGAARLELCMDVWRRFNFPEVPDVILDVLRRQENNPGEWRLSVTVIPEEFPRISIDVPSPSEKDIRELIDIVGGDFDQLKQFGKALGKDAPDYVEYLFLSDGFGYEVYREGISVQFKYQF
eukprot:TRINITY_DN2896_c0_g2_i1.p1 TRINITY_DN2896_c0_g2~~TRINITY_DN2896_c0_g2_i1.p1  ORF type:complete len:607 (-),score=151.61 TRINITY_DN2896_c0_g2_i1:54-1874(-)